MDTQISNMLLKNIIKENKEDQKVTTPTNEKDTIDYIKQKFCNYFNYSINNINLKNNKNYKY